MSPRCLASKAVAGDPPLPPSENENGKKPLGAASAAAGAGLAAAGAEPLFTRGAGVGSGTSSATAEAAANTTHAIASRNARDPGPIITLSPCLKHVRLATAES